MPAQHKPSRPHSFFGRLLCTFALVLAALVLTAWNASAQSAMDTAVLVSATVQEIPAQITLQWPADPNANGYLLYRKAPMDLSWGAPIPLPRNANTYVDTNVTLGTVYEYKIVKAANIVQAGSSYIGYGYLTSGIDVPLTENRGTLILMVENTYAADLSVELDRLQQDLEGDGWKVVRHDVGRNDPVPAVKALILADYQADPANVRAVFLFGHVPVPYAGLLNPDGHPDHYGAWPADVFYATLSGTWTDSAANDTSADRAENRNVPGDGKYDQTHVDETGGHVDLQIGRVDLSNMTAFLPRTEKDLLRQYLNKDHNFRHKLIIVQSRGLIHDTLDYFGGEAFASDGWRSFSAFFGAANIVEQPWFPALSAQSYLWGYTCGLGSYYGAIDVGSESDYATTDTQVVFTMMFGSYFGDWDIADNFLRAPLATTTYGLTCCWAGRPHWFLHPMGLGETIGTCTRLTQNNTGYGTLYLPLDFGDDNGVHVALMGDPSLRLHPVAPASQLSARDDGAGNVTLAWNPSPDAALGYNLYRADAPEAPFLRLNSTPLSTTTFLDTGVSAGFHRYMLRALTRQSSASGSYLNASQGLFATVHTVAVSGVLSLQGCVNPIQSISFEFRPQDGSGRFRRIVTLASDGSFGLGDLPAKRYQVWIKGAKWLARVVEVDASGGSVTGVTATLLAGDVNNDNAVTTSDYLLLKAAFGSTPSSPNWNLGADLNCDGVVSTTDYLLLKVNFGLQGDP